jgi:TolB-like protein
MPAAGKGTPTPGNDNRHPLSQETIRAQLGKILAAPEFQSSAMLCNFLGFIVEKTLAGQANEIKGYTVATQVLGRKTDFDPDKDPIVRILAGKLRRTLERYYLVQGGLDPVKIDIPKGAYVPTFQLASREEAGGGGTGAAAATPTRARFSGPSVAVLPLLNLTGDRKQEYFADGLAEELTNELARYQDLRVIAFQSTLRWKGKRPDAREVGRDLGVRFLLEGSVRKEAGSVKIVASLIDTVN